MNRAADQSPAPAPARELWRLVLAALVPVVALLILFMADVPLGKPGKFVYRYSPVVELRLLMLPLAGLLAVVGGLAVYLLDQARRSQRICGGLLTLAALGGWGWWTLTAPPAYRAQHVFNMLSPSQDGAFLIEARHLLNVGLRDYLAGFPQRAATPPEQMKGTRVISNPPGTTVLLAGVLHALDHWPAARRWLARDLAEPGMTADDLRLTTEAYAAALVLLWLWLLASWPTWLLWRLFFDPAPAAALTLTTIVTPMTLLFVPGKDPAQLLVVTLALWLWLYGLRRRGLPAAFLAGVVAALAVVVSLAHVWVGAIVLVATLTSPHVNRGWLLRRGLPAALSGLVGTIVLWGLLLDFDLLRSALAVARAQAHVTRGPGSMPLIWQALGIPLFALLAGACLWYLLPRAFGRPATNHVELFGRRVLALCLLVLVATVGFTNVETPRLWIVFVPLLMLGAALQAPVLRRTARRRGLLLALLVGLHLAAASVQWSLLDARETEFRLQTQPGGAPRLFH